MKFTNIKINFETMIFISILIMYLLIIVVLLEIVYFENHLRELVTLINNLRGN